MAQCNTRWLTDLAYALKAPINVIRVAILLYIGWKRCVWSCCSGVFCFLQVVQKPERRRGHVQHSTLWNWAQSFADCISRAVSFFFFFKRHWLWRLRTRVIEVHQGIFNMKNSLFSCWFKVSMRPLCYGSISMHFSGFIASLTCVHEIMEHASDVSKLLGWHCVSLVVML